MARAVILLSGGLDSSTTLALARERGDELFAFSVNYGQRHAVELQRAQAIAQAMNVTDHCIVPIDLRAIGGSALTDLIDVPKNQLGDGVPITYVPARNTILLGLALGYAETVGAFDIHIGVNILDYSGYPDCRPAFLEAFENLANLATKAGVEGTGRFTIHAPLLKLTKAEIIREATPIRDRHRIDHELLRPQLGRQSVWLLRLVSVAQERFRRSQHCGSDGVSKRGFTTELRQRKDGEE